MALGVKIGANWAALSPLLDEALELPSQERADWLESLPSKHQAVKTELRRLLAMEEEASYEPAAGDEVGPWRLTNKLGEGGMAKVWMAERADGLMARPIALKLPQTGWHNSLFCRRLAKERDVLDALNHPNIARLLDAGMAANGQPYLAIEYVEGVRIDEYCRSRRLSIADRLEVFLCLARAIAYAHRALVLHRDLKPANILITAEGDVRVLDFGIAKILEQGKTEETDLTLFSGRALTLDYASPEQIAGLPLTVASDVYSLGVVLYELLAGCRPYRLKRRSAAELEEQILEVSPEPPSEAVSEKQIRNALRGDLDRVVLKALKKLPEERYLTVDAFAEDIERYLQRRPVLARPDRSWYRFSLFVRRHRLGFLAGLVVLAILLASTIVVARQVHVALMEKRRAEEVKGLFISMLFDAHAYSGVGKPVSALDLLRKTQQRLTKLSSFDAATRVQILTMLGAGLLSQQDTANTEATAALALRESASLPPSHPSRFEARVLRSWVLLFRGETEIARRETDQLIADIRHYGTAQAEDVAGAWRIRSEIALQQGDSARAVSCALAALRVVDAKLDPHHLQAVLGLVALTYAYAAADEKESALKTGEEALRRALETYSNSAKHPNVLKARMALARALAVSGQFDRAIDTAQGAIRDTSALFGPSSRLVGLDLRRLAEMQLMAGQWRAAEESSGRSYSILRDHYNAGSPGMNSLQALRAEIRSGRR